MEIRRLERRDELRDAHRAHGLAWEEAYDGILPDAVIEQVAETPSAEELDSRFERLRDQDRDFFVAVDDTATVRGHAYFRWGDDAKEFVGPDEAGLKEIYVEPGYWGQGVGTALLERGIDALPEDVTRLKLEMLSENDVGEKFYDARGFEPVEETTRTIGDESYPVTVYALDL